MRNYPFYIVQSHGGRLPCPPQYRHTTVEREFTSGRIGGKRLVEDTTEDPQEAHALWLRSNRQATIYEVPRHGSQRRRIRVEEILRRIRESRCHS